MNCVEVLRIATRLNRPVSEFVTGYPILRGLASDSSLSPLEWVVAGFVAEIEPGEEYHAWVIRQVKDILETQVCRDTAAGIEAGRLVHSSQTIRGVEFDARDRDWILDTLAVRPDVYEIWVKTNARCFARAA
jgi:hypothetical protein